MRVRCEGYSHATMLRVRAEQRGAYDASTRKIKRAYDARVRGISPRYYKCLLGWSIDRHCVVLLLLAYICDNHHDESAPKYFQGVVQVDQADDHVLDDERIDQA